MYHVVKIYCIIKKITIPLQYIYGKYIHVTKSNNFPPNKIKYHTI